MRCMLLLLRSFILFNCLVRWLVLIFFNILWISCLVIFDMISLMINMVNVFSRLGIMVVKFVSNCLRIFYRLKLVVFMVELFWIIDYLILFKFFFGSEGLWLFGDVVGFLWVCVFSLVEIGFVLEFFFVVMISILIILGIKILSNCFINWSDLKVLNNFCFVCFCILGWMVFVCCFKSCLKLFGFFFMLLYYWLGE